MVICLGERVKVLQKGKITIPADIREKMGIREGDCVELQILNNKLVILPPNTVPNPTETLIGLTKGTKIREPIQNEIKKAAADRVNRKLQRATE